MASERIEKLKTRARAQSLNELVVALHNLTTKPGRLDEPEGATRAVLVDAICERSPSAKAAFDAWAASNDPGSEIPAVLSAVVLEGMRGTEAGPGNGAGTGRRP